MHYSYKKARKFLMGNIHLKKEGPNYSITSLYCQKKFTESDFPKNKGPGPDRIPNHNIINAEHLWPQSRFSHKHPKKLQKSDLHSLYPAKQNLNSNRGNLSFAEVVTIKKSLCLENKLGRTRESTKVYFEPESSIRGDIARALFYFSIRYQVPIGDTEESFLRKWHKEDPINIFETEKNEKVFTIQKNRNPFIDYPEWVELVADF